MKLHLIAAVVLALAAGPALGGSSDRVLVETTETSASLDFGGTVEWTMETEDGRPVLVARADVPERKLGVEVRFRRNTDPSLPASHIVEITFDVGKDFTGASIASLRNIVAKDSELGKGTPLAGAGARIVGNSFLYALSGAPQDTRTNSSLLIHNTWIDVQVVYQTGRKAVLTLEKDREAAILFAQMFD